MLKTQITGAKYLSPQTNQMTNLNIAVPADSKDTKFGTSDILLAKDVVAYLNALDSDISNELDAQTDKINKINESIKQLIDHNLIKIVTELPTTDIDKNCIYLVPNKDGEGNNVFIEYIYVESKNTFEEVGRIQAKVDLSNYYTKEETDNLILIAKNSAINIHNEDYTKSIKLDINDTEAVDNDHSPVNISLTYLELDSYFVDINASDGFRHLDDHGNESNLHSSGLNIVDGHHVSDISASLMSIYNSDIGGSIEINANKDLTEEEQEDGYSPVDISLTDANCSANINAKYGFVHKTDEGSVATLNGNALTMKDPTGRNLLVGYSSISINNKQHYPLIDIGSYAQTNQLCIGLDEEFKISRPADDTEGATITGIKSLTAFSNPSATKVWATDGSTVDLSTKANTSDVLLKKSASGGYYIGSNSNELGTGAFAVSSSCSAKGAYSHAEGSNTIAVGLAAHAEGSVTNAKGAYSHAEGRQTYANGFAVHTEGSNTIADGFAAHALGAHNVANINAIHSVGIGDFGRKKNAEYIYTKNNESGTKLINDPKNGYKYLIGIGGYDGISTDNTTYKSVQEVIADLTARIEQLETKVRALEAANTPA